MGDKEFDLAKGFLARQKALSASLKIPLEFTKHPTALGDASEADWAGMLTAFLPARYAVGKVFALSHDGKRSLQLDLAIYDRQYSPLWFEAGGHRYVPAESIYAVLEAKQEINATNLKDAANKVASVRVLDRQSGPIVDIYGVQNGPPVGDRPILGGIVALRSVWKGGLESTTANAQILKHKGDGHLDLGVALVDRAFSHVPAEVPTSLLTPGFALSSPGTQLAFFTLTLFRRLQAIGTALAVNLDSYQRVLDQIDIDTYAEEDIT
jgi:hypothetical protein